MKIRNNINEFLGIKETIRLATHDLGQDNNITHLESNYIPVDLHQDLRDNADHLVAHGSLLDDIHNYTHLYDPNYLVQHRNTLPKLNLNLEEFNNPTYTNPTGPNHKYFHDYINEKVAHYMFPHIFEHVPHILDYVAEKMLPYPEKRKRLAQSIGFGFPKWIPKNDNILQQHEAYPYVLAVLKRMQNEFREHRASFTPDWRYTSVHRNPDDAQGFGEHSTYDPFLSLSRNKEYKEIENNLREALSHIGLKRHQVLNEEPEELTKEEDRIADLDNDAVQARRLRKYLKKRKGK